MEPCSHGGWTCLISLLVIVFLLPIKWMWFTKNNHLMSCIRYANALHAVIISIWTPIDSTTKFTILWVIWKQDIDFIVKPDIVESIQKRVLSLVTILRFGNLRPLLTFHKNPQVIADWHNEERSMKKSYLLITVSKQLHTSIFGKSVWLRWIWIKLAALNRLMISFLKSLCWIKFN